jgi:hypothetical protein
VLSACSGGSVGDSSAPSDEAGQDANKNSPPEWENLVSSVTLAEGESLTLSIGATDPDGGSVIITASGLPTWASFIGGTLQADPQQGDSGYSLIEFTASDGLISLSETLTINVEPGEVLTKAPWTAYLGVVGTDESPEWASWIRNWMVGVTGMNLVNDPTLESKLSQKASAALLGGDLMMPIPGFARNEDNMAEFLDLIHDGGVTTWQATVRTQVETIFPLDPAASRVFYQLGNEITTEKMSLNVRKWAASRGIFIPGEAIGYDPETIFYYVEYYLAPSVEAALSASESLYGDRDAINLVLGSIGNGGTTGGRNWLDLLLDYEIQGSFAPSLAGVKVYDIVDIISVQYVGSTENLDFTWDKWMNVGNIKGLWTTEEIGHNSAKSGESLGRALITAASHLHWFYDRNISPAESRVAFFDWNLSGPIADTSADDSMSLLFDFFGHTPFDTFKEDFTVPDDATQYSKVQLHSLLEPNKRAITVWAVRNEGAVTFNSTHMDAEGWTGTVEVTIYYFSPAGIVSETYTTQASQGVYTIPINEPVILGAETRHALLVTLEQL